MNSLDIAIDKINELMIKDHFLNHGKMITMSKTQLYGFCLKLLRILKEENSESD